MPHSTELCRKILEKSLQLTSLRDEGALVAEFFQLLLAQFEDLESVSLFKFERLYTGTSLSFEAFQYRNENLLLKPEHDEEILNVSSENCLDKETIESLRDAVLKDISIDEKIKSISDHHFFIKRVNQDKQAVFFMAYQLIDKPDIEIEDETETQIQLIRYLSELYSNHQLLISLNDKDSLTGLYNRKFFDRKMHQLSQVNNQIRRQVEKKKGTCLAILDIDHFKRINDNYGHLYGDEVLLHFAQQMQKIFRDDDFLFRYGGEEFVVILINVELTQAEKILHRFRIHIENFDFPKVDQITVSIGVTKVDVHTMQNVVIDHADLALYYIKEHGRNNVACYETLVADGLLREIITQDDIELF